MFWYILRRLHLALLLLNATHYYIANITRLVRELPNCSFDCQLETLLDVCGFEHVNNLTCQCRPSIQPKLNAALKPCFAKECKPAEVRAYHSISSKICSIYSSDVAAGIPIFTNHPPFASAPASPSSSSPQSSDGSTGPRTGSGAGTPVGVVLAVVGVGAVVAIVLLVRRRRRRQTLGRSASQTEDKPPDYELPMIPRQVPGASSANPPGQDSEAPPPYTNDRDPGDGRIDSNEPAAQRLMSTQEHEPSQS